VPAEDNKVALSILDLDGFEVTLPYAVGHAINEAEARVLNQTRRENLGNNFRAKVRAHLDSVKAGDKPEFTEDELRAQFAELDANYVFTVANVAAAAKLTPEEREARKLAREYLKGELEKAGRKIGDAPEGMSDEDWKAVIEEEVDRIAQDEAIVKIAKDTIKQRNKIGSVQLSTSLTAGATGGEEQAA
jgi:uncharacterized protein YnzC (UPF0291/DUF896 family)